MDEDFKFDKTKSSVLSHVQTLFHELEEDMAMSHQEKYTLLEDAFENAADVDELRVAYEQWFAEHAEALDIGQDLDELWGYAMTKTEDEEGDEDSLEE